MSRIKSYGVAFPQYRVEDKILFPRQAVKRSAQRAVCFSDEDVITLAYESASSLPNERVDGIFFATSTPVFHNRYHASFLADLLNLNSGILALDFTSGPRSGTDALLMANDLIDSGKYRNILVIAAGVDFPGIGNEKKRNTGHAACAILLSNEDGIGELHFGKSFSSALAETFTYKKNDIELDARFARDAGFKTNILLSLQNAILDAGSYDVVILNSPFARIAGPVFMKCGFNEAQFVKDEVQSLVGDTGAVHALLLVLVALESGKKKILLADYGNGTNLLEITSNYKHAGDTILQKANARSVIETYQDYLLLRKAGNFRSARYESREMFSSEMMAEREKNTMINRTGKKCTSCGTVYFLDQARCKKCKSGQFTPHDISGNGKVYALTHEHYFPVSFPPVTMVVIDMEGGGRMTVQQTDVLYPEKNTLTTGSSVRLVLRKMLENGARPDYFWKAKLI